MNEVNDGPSQLDVNEGLFETELWFAIPIFRTNPAAIGRQVLRMSLLIFFLLIHQDRMPDLQHRFLSFESPNSIVGMLGVQS